MEHEIVLGKFEGWGREYPMTLSDRDRAFHSYLIGRSGMGKTSLMQQMVRQDIEAGKGCGIIDPHGDVAEALLSHIPRHRIDDVIYLDPSLQNYRVVINPFYQPPTDPAARANIGYGVVSTFKHLWHDAWGETRLQYILTNCILGLLDAPSYLRPTLASIPLMLVHEGYRKQVVRFVKNGEVKWFFEHELEQWGKRYLDEAIGPVQNRVGQFLTHPTLRQTFGSYQPTIDFKRAIDEGNILIVRIPKGILGEEPTNYFGSFILGGLQAAAMARADQREEDREPFYLAIDEFQNFGTDATKQIFSEARKFGLYLTIAHQYLDQLEDNVREAVFGNVGSYISFRVGEGDADILAREIDGFNAGIIGGLGRGQVVAQLIRNGTPGNAIMGTTFAPTEGSKTHVSKIKQISRKRYHRKPSKVDAQVTTWLRQFS